MTVLSKSFPKLVLGLLLSAFFLYLAFRNVTFDELRAALKGVKYGWLALMFSCLLASHLARSLRWRYLLDPLKKGIGIRNLFSSVMIGYLMNNILPRAGEIVRPLAISRLESVSTSSAFGTIVLERIVDILTFLALILAIPFVYDGPLRETFPWLVQAGVWTAIATVSSLMVFMLLVSRRSWMDRAFVSLERLLPKKAGSRIEKAVHSFLDGFLLVKRPGSFLPIFVLTVIVWGLYLLMMYVSFFAFDIQLGMDAALVVLAISSIGVAIPTPGGTGTYHFFTAETLTSLFLVDRGVALSFAAATHAVGFVGVSVIGVYFFLRDHFKVTDLLTRTHEEKG